MTDIVPASDPSVALVSMLARAAGRNVTPARDTQEAVAHAFAFLAGIYGAQWQPAMNGVTAWCIALGDAEPDEVAEAVIRHVRDLERGRFPPNASDLADKIGAIRAQVWRKRGEIERNLEHAVLERAGIAAPFERGGPKIADSLFEQIGSPKTREEVQSPVVRDQIQQSAQRIARRQYVQERGSLASIKPKPSEL